MSINVQDKREAQITDIDILCECRRGTRRPQNRVKAMESHELPWIIH